MTINTFQSINGHLVHFIFFSLKMFFDTLYTCLQMLCDSLYIFVLKNKVMKISADQPLLISKFYIFFIM